MTRLVKPRRLSTIASVAVVSLLTVFLSPLDPAATIGSLPQTMADSNAAGQIALTSGLEAYLNDLKARDRCSGVVLLAKNGKVLLEHACGFANKSFEARNQPNTKFNVASLGKMFTAVAVLQLAAAGKLGLYDSILKLVPDYPDRDIARRVTVQQLLTHTSGMGDIFNQKFDETSKSKLRDIKDYLPLFLGEPLSFEPGSHWGYSNAGYIVLGLIIERVSGSNYFDYVRRNIFALLEMVDTDCFDVDADVANLALGYTFVGVSEGGPRRTNTLGLAARGSSAGGCYSTVQDLLKFANALNSSQLLDAIHRDALLTGKVTIPARAGEARYAYGMFDRRINDVRIVGHNGGAPGISDNLDMYPDLGYTLIVLSNYDHMALAVTDWVREALTAREMISAVEMTDSELDKFAGTYLVDATKSSRVGSQSEISISRHSHELLVELGSDDRRDFRFFSDDRAFDEDDVSVQIIFNTTANKQVTGIKILGLAQSSVTATRRR